jgi:DNA-binding IclR family transcriptional regulator
MVTVTEEPKASANNASKPVAVLSTILEIIASSKEGTNIATLREKSGLGPRQVSNALYKLTRKGEIKTKKRGVYVVK